MEGVYLSSLKKMLEGKLYDEKESELIGEPYQTPFTI
jgi:hypothetical protein